MKILDFGIAKLSGSPMTAPGFTPGTVSYMSPEQTRAEATDARTEIRSLGVVMYEMLRGGSRFGARTRGRWRRRFVGGAEASAPSGDVPARWSTW